MRLYTFCIQKMEGVSHLEASDGTLAALKSLANARHAHGDGELMLNPVAQAQEQFEPADSYQSSEDQGLVLEPDGGVFTLKMLAPRRHDVHVTAFCDGIRTTYPVGFEGNYPLAYARHAAGVRVREPATGYHAAMPKVERSHATLLAPFGRFSPRVQALYQRTGLVSSPQADLCWAGDADGVQPAEMEHMGSLAWQGRALRRARRLLDYSEQVVAVAGAKLLRDQDPSGSSWLLKDGSLFQFDRRFLRSPDSLRCVVSCVKTHPIMFFGLEGERSIVRLGIGERSVAFLPRPTAEAHPKPPGVPSTLANTYRPMISWYLRVRPRDFKNGNMLNGIVRLDIAATPDWEKWVDEVSWAVLDEFYGISAMPDPRHDVMPYGIFECEQSLKAQQIPANLLLAQLG